MRIELHNLVGSPTRKRRKRVGRGSGSGLGKTCGRGTKGAGSRSGYKRRHGSEGGGAPLYMRLPTKGFSRGAFRKEKVVIVNLEKLDQRFEEGDEVNIESLRQKGLCKRGSNVQVKVLAKGELRKKLSIALHAISKSAREKLEDSGSSFALVQKRG